MSFNAAERRKERRVRLRIPALLRWLDGEGIEITEEMFTTSISDSGAGFETLRMPPVGGNIKVIFNPHSLRGSSSATVKWAVERAHGFEIGVSFND